MGVSSRRYRIGFVICSVLLLVIASSFAATAAAKKFYTADVSPHTVETNSTTTYTFTVTNKAGLLTTQNVGSCNLTAPAGFAVGAVTQGPSTGTATPNGNTIEMRNLSTLPQTSRTVKFTATAASAAGSYAWSVICRQANNFNSQAPSNEFVLDVANSNLNTTVVDPPPPAPSSDIAVTGNLDSQDPVTASNTVIYIVTVHNGGPAASGAITLTDSVLNGGSITSIDGGPNWTCSGSGASGTCTHAALASGADAETVAVYVVTPDADTVITNRASVSQAVNTDPAPSNNTLDQNTTVNKNTTCTSGQVSCGSGTIDYSKPSQVQSCTTPTMAVFLCGKVTFAPTSSSGTQIYNLFGYKTPENVCPVSLGSSTLVACDWELFVDNVPAAQSVGGTVVVATCHQSKCPAGLGDAGTIVVYIGANNARQLLNKCSGPGDTNKCWERSRIGGNLVITVRNIPPGDPKIAGRCVAGC